MKKFLLVGFSFFILTTSDCCAQWQQSNGPYDGSVRCMVETSAGLFVGTLTNGVFFSPDQAQTWTAVNNGLTCTQIMCLLNTGDTILAGTTYGVFQSVNNAVSWIHISPNYFIFDLYYDGNSIYAATGNGLYRSADHGAHWVFIDVGFGNTTVRYVTSINGILYAGTEANGMVASSDHGITWSPLVNFPGSWITQINSNGSSLLVLSNTGNYISYDWGQTWSSYNIGLPCPYGNSITVKDSNYYSAGMKSFLIDTKQQGVIWNTIHAFDFYAIASFFSNDDIYILTSGGIMKSTDYGQTFTRCNYGLNACMVNSIASDAGNVYASSQGGGIFKSVDDGINWTPCNNGLNECMLGVIRTNGPYVFAGGLNIYRSSDQGNTWFQSTIPQNNHGITDIAFYGSDVYTATSSDGIFKSVDNGQTFFQTNNGMTEMNFYDLEIIDTVILAASYHGLYRSTDQGNSWNFSMTGIPDSTVYNFAVMNGIVLATTDSGIYRSSDYGLSWNNIPIGTHISKSWHIYSDGHYIYTATIRDGIFMTADAGNTWIPFSAGLPDSVGNCFGSKTNAYRVFLGGTGEKTSGVWYENMVYNSVYDQSNSGFTFETYPQPFSDKLNIRYELGHSSNVTINVFDLSGRKVDQLINEDQSAGKHQLSWKSNSAGIYFVQICAGDYTRMQKVIRN
jgi:photosystem II stability/assembly factor-like uncharacterized protein